MLQEKTKEMIRYFIHEGRNKDSSFSPHIFSESISEARAIRAFLKENADLFGIVHYIQELENGNFNIFLLHDIGGNNVFDPLCIDCDMAKTIDAISNCKAGSLYFGRSNSKIVPELKKVDSSVIYVNDDREPWKILSKFESLIEKLVRNPNNKEGYVYTDRREYATLCFQAMQLNKFTNPNIRDSDFPKVSIILVQKVSSDNFNLFQLIRSPFDDTGILYRLVTEEFCVSPERVCSILNRRNCQSLILMDKDFILLNN